MGLEHVLRYAIPYWHPLAVHFPLVTLVLAGGAAVGYAVRGQAVWREATLWLLALGTVTAYWAYRTGHVLEEAVEGEPTVDQLIDYHEKMAEWTLWAGSGAALVTLGITLWLRRRSPGERLLREPLLPRVVVLAVACAAALLVAYTGHIGATMVWGVPK